VKINPRPSINLVAILVISAGVSLSLHAQTALSPQISPSAGQPPSGAPNPTNAFGLLGSGAATEITPEGYLRTGFAELMFFAGADLDPTDAHIRSLDPTDAHIGTLEQAHPPIVYYELTRDGIAYHFTIFAAKIDKSAIVRARQHAKFPFMPGFNIESDIYEPTVNFIRVKITNSARGPRQAVFASGVRYDGPGAAGTPRGNDGQVGEAFNRGWMNYFDDANFYRFNRDLYAFPAGYADRSFTIRKNWSEPNPQYVLGVTHVDSSPNTPIGIVTYARKLKPGESWTLDFKMPLIPNADPFAISAIDDSSFDTVETQMKGAEMNGTQIHAEPGAQH
jgi:hypothetical protein